VIAFKIDGAQRQHHWMLDVGRSMLDVQSVYCSGQKVNNCRLEFKICRFPASDRKIRPASEWDPSSLIHVQLN
jgi:hypothetical protein